jgi:hypothetical protein
MFCPNCGAKNSQAQNFCRACGIGLEEISSALAVQRPRGIDTLTPEKSALDKAGEVGMIGLGGVGLIGVGWLIYKIFMIFVLGGVAPAMGVLGILGIICAILTLVWVVRREIEKDAKKERRLATVSTPGDEFERGETSQLSEGIRQPASITEGTTRNLSR